MEIVNIDEGNIVSEMSQVIHAEIIILRTLEHG